MKKTISLSDIPHVVKDYVIPHLSNKNIITFIGPLGAGKTTFIKEIFKQYGITDIISSPTFSYVNTYKTPNNKTLHHFDLYRINSLESFIQSGFEDYLEDKDALIFIEWPEIIAPLLENPKYQSHVWTICINHIANTPQKRLISLLS